MTTTITKREAMLNQINIFLSRWSQDLIEEMASYYYFCSTDYCTLPAAERRELAKSRFEKERETVTKRVLDILEGNGNRYYQIKKLFSEYVVDHDAEDYAFELVQKYNQLDK